jgi:hypothetical protein
MAGAERIDGNTPMVTFLAEAILKDSRILPAAKAVEV